MSLPRWMEPLLEAGEMREVDRWAIHERKVAVDQLMERAGEGLASVITRRAPAGRIVIVCGKGNNGGDGVVAARLLRQAGRDVEVLVVWPPEWMGEDAQVQIKKLHMYENYGTVEYYHKRYQSYFRRSPRGG